MMISVKTPVEECRNIWFQIIEDMKGKGINKELKRYTILDMFVPASIKSIGTISIEIK